MSYLSQVGAKSNLFSHLQSTCVARLDIWETRSASTLKVCSGRKSACSFFCLRVQFSQRESAQVESKSSHFFFVGEFFDQCARPEQALKVWANFSPTFLSTPFCLSVRLSLDQNSDDVVIKATRLIIMWYCLLICYTLRTCCCLNI